MVATRLVYHYHLQLNYHNSHTQRGKNHYHGNDLSLFLGSKAQPNLFNWASLKLKTFHTLAC